MTNTLEWIVVLFRVPARPSGPRVAIWRELRRAGAVSLASRGWVLPAMPQSEEVVQRARDLCLRAGGDFAAVRGQGFDEASAAILREAYTAARAEEWEELGRECRKFREKVQAHGPAGKLTLGELEEEEQDLDKLNRWARELRRRDMLVSPAADAVADELARCSRELDRYMGAVFGAIRGSEETPQGQEP